MVKFRWILLLLAIIFLIMLSRVVSIGIDRTGLKCLKHQWTYDKEQRLLFQVFTVQFLYNPPTYHCLGTYNPKSIQPLPTQTP